MSQISVGRASGWGELHHVICDQCGWRSRPIDAVLEEGAWRRAKAHRCDQDEYAEEAEDELADEQQAQDDPVARPMIPEPTEADVEAARDELDQMETVQEQALSVAGTLGWAVLESTPGTHSTRIVALAHAWQDLCSTRAYVAQQRAQQAQQAQDAQGDPVSQGISLLAEIAAERARQDAKWGQQNHPDGTISAWIVYADVARNRCREKADAGSVTWADILREEVYEALAEDDPARLRAELIQVAAVAVAWIEAIDRRPTGPVCARCGDQPGVTMLGGRSYCQFCHDTFPAWLQDGDETAIEAIDRRPDSGPVCARCGAPDAPYLVDGQHLCVFDYTVGLFATGGGEPR